MHIGRGRGLVRNDVTRGHSRIAIIRIAKELMTAGLGRVKRA
ncbi:hypothetical protein EMIT0357P_50041 [Pseudomonas marginalis]